MCVAAKFVVQADRAAIARYARVRMRRDRGWAMLSEIEVIGAH